MTKRSDKSKKLRVKIHPQGLKMALKGHPWLTKDSYTEKFPHSHLLIAVDEQGKDQFVFLHDPKHKLVKGRIWSMTRPCDISENNFQAQLKQRIHHSLENRKDIKSIEFRENYYLVFAEADELPGLEVLHLGENILIKYTSFFWEKYTELIVNELKKVFPDETYHYWLQVRVGKLSDIKAISKDRQEKKFTISEYGVQYEINFHDPDIGLYTDMSGVRYELEELLSNRDSVLNLYAYTGALGLYSLSLGANELVSVDLSQKYLNRLQKNIELNPSFENKKTTNLKMSSEEGLDLLIKKDRKFDVIICDPPSVSVGKSAKETPLKKYERYFPKFSKLQNKDDLLIVFLNTHSITKKKFKDKITPLLRNYEIIKSLGLQDDCRSLKNFPEGDYLKGLVLKRK